MKMPRDSMIANFFLIGILEPFGHRRSEGRASREASLRHKLPKQGILCLGTNMKSVRPSHWVFCVMDDAPRLGGVNEEERLFLEEMTETTIQYLQGMLHVCACAHLLADLDASLPCPRRPSQDGSHGKKLNRFHR